MPYLLKYYALLFLMLAISLCSNAQQTLRPQMPTDTFFVYMGADSLEVYFVNKPKKEANAVVHSGDMALLGHSYRLIDTLAFGDALNQFFVLTLNDDGDLLSVSYYRSGRQEGYYYDLYPSGKVKRQAYYKDGVLEGKEYNLSTNGMVWLEINYLHGWYHGEVRHYTNSGNKLSVVTKYVNGQMHGIRTKYYANGKKQSETVYSNGIPLGEGRSYNKKGKLTYINVYQNGKLVQRKKP